MHPSYRSVSYFVFDAYLLEYSPVRNWYERNVSDICQQASRHSLAVVAIMLLKAATARSSSARCTFAHTPRTYYMSVFDDVFAEFKVANATATCSIFGMCPISLLCILAST